MVVMDATAGLSGDWRGARPVEDCGNEPASKYKGDVRESVLASVYAGFCDQGKEIAVNWGRGLR
jgi:hypothetical protein